MELEPLFVHHPKTPPHVYKLIMVLPALLVPVAILIYFTEGNLTQALSIAGFGIGLGLAFLGLFKLANIINLKKVVFLVTAEGKMKINRFRNSKSVDLNQVELVKFQWGWMHRLGNIAEIHVQKRDGTHENWVYAHFTREERERLRTVLAKFGVKLNEASH